MMFLGLKLKIVNRQEPLNDKVQVQVQIQSPACDNSYRNNTSTYTNTGNYKRNNFDPYFNERCLNERRQNKRNETNKY